MSFLSIRPSSSELNPYDLSLWGYLKDKVLNTNPCVVGGLKETMQQAVFLITTEPLQAILEKFIIRLSRIILQERGYISYVYSDLKKKIMSFIHIVSIV
jgi:hypothetical protein